MHFNFTIKFHLYTASKELLAASFRVFRFVMINEGRHGKWKMINLKKFFFPR